MFKFFRGMFLFGAFSLVSTAAQADTNAAPTSNPAPASESVEQRLVAALRREEELRAELDRHRKPNPSPEPKSGGHDEDLRIKVRKDQETQEEKGKQTREIERALGFNMRMHSFASDNKDLLPAEVGAIIAQADKETYDNATAKASAVKSAIIQSYFSVEGNMDALTPAQRVTLDDYLKLTKTAKEAKAADIYENIFEPALETIRKIKKAEEVGRSRGAFGADSKGTTAYKDKLVALARKTHLGERTA